MWAWSEPDNIWDVFSKSNVSHIVLDERITEAAVHLWMLNSVDLTYSHNLWLWKNEIKNETAEKLAFGQGK